MIQMPSGPGGDSPAQNAESIKIEEHNPPQVNKPAKMSKKAKKDLPKKPKTVIQKLTKQQLKI